MPLASCPHCREDLDVPDEFAGRDVRCASCQAVFAVPAADDHLPAARRVGGARRPTAPPDDDPDLLARRRPAARPRSLAWVWLLLAGVFGMFCLGCGGLVGLVVWVDHPRFQPYDSPDGRFQAEFPGPPAAATQTDDEGRPRKGVEFRRQMPVPETYFVHYADLLFPPAGAAADRELAAACDKAVNRVPGSKEESRSTGAHDGHRAADLYVTHPDGSATVVRFVLAGRRVYAVGITGAGLTPDSPRLDHFHQAFKVTDEPAGPKK